MSVHLQREIERLRKQVLAEAAMVEEALEKALRAVKDRNAALALEVIEGDRAIDAAEIEVEEECLKILALYTPVARDLRFIVTVLKMNNDLERMGDIVVSIARRADFLARHETVPPMPPDFDIMVQGVCQMVRKSLDALINGDDELALKICQYDDQVDELKRKIAGELRDRIAEDPANLRVLLKMVDLTRHLERIADLATNIAEDVVYLVRGEIVRHAVPEN
ncbi:MAG: phosphate signaling complex protein PhoU [Candidatus Sumerlaeia bacterium]|nr:phosphate signaling complex protein PhoU [Candidatus Sumerlaeia bacterium]